MSISVAKQAFVNSQGAIVYNIKLGTSASTGIVEVFKVPKSAFKAFGYVKVYDIAEVSFRTKVFGNAKACGILRCLVMPWYTTNRKCHRGSYCLC